MDAMPHNPRRESANLMSATWTKASKVRRAFKAGKKRKNDIVLTPKRAMFEAYILLGEVRDAMREAGLPESDVQAALVLLMKDGSPGVDLIYIARIPDTQHIPELNRKLKALEKEGPWDPVGVILMQLDREADPKSGSAVWGQPWLVNPRAARALFEAGKAAAAGKEGKLAFS
jgi:hypothetical protein